MSDGQQPNFNELVSGKDDPHLNKFIRIVIIQNRDYIVYLDNDLNVQWHTNQEKTKSLGKILNQIAVLEGKSDFMNPSKWQKLTSTIFKEKQAKFADFFRDDSLQRIRSLLGEAIARIFDDKDENEAKVAIDEAVKLIAVKNAEYSRRWYYGHARYMALISLILALLAWIEKTSIINVFGLVGFQLGFSSFFGAIGAYVFTAQRGRKIDLDAISGALIHKTEATARIATGMVSAVLVVLSIKSGLIFSSISTSNSLKFMVIVSILAGYSEKLIPNMVKNFEDKIAVASISENNLYSKTE
jgi:hypothetical protein